MRTLIGSFIVLFGVFTAGCAAESTSSSEDDVDTTTGTLFRADDVSDPFTEELPRLNVVQHSPLEAANEQRGIPTIPSKLRAAAEDHPTDRSSTLKIGE